jgi:tRNA threonylcarbamoyl adenosine modification protein YjeE
MTAARGSGVWVVGAVDQAGTERFAASLARMLRPGDVVTLGGGLGAGKTTFARALIRALAQDPELEVPSPTFTLIQTYETPLPVVHADLYRIGSPDELEALGWNEAGDGALMLIEWAERAGTLPPDRLEVVLDIAGDSGEGRTIALYPHGSFAERLDMIEAIHEVIEAAGYGDAERRHLQGDASSRAYDRLVRPDGDSAILMIAPRRPDGPAVRHGKPYSQIARLAEDVKPFVAMAQGLRARGFSAPEIYAANLEAGLLVTEDLGPETAVENGAPIEERYMEAVAVLAALHQMNLPQTLPVDGATAHTIPPYDLDALLIECELLLDWYLPHRGHTALSANARNAFVDLWTAALQPLLARPLTWTLRDYHSPNLIWLPAREGIRRVGLIDFQDCVLGPPAYDVVSLSQDARIDVPDDLELRLVSHYVRLRRAADPEFDAATFAADYAIMGAERATKILGIFARLNARDGKPGYLRHLPRIERNVRRCLLHPALEPLAAWYRQHLPMLFVEG